MAAPRMVPLLPWWQPEKWKGCTSLWSDSPAFAARGERLLCHMPWGTGIVAFSFCDPFRLFHISLIRHFFMFNWSHFRSKEAWKPPLLITQLSEPLPQQAPAYFLFVGLFVLICFGFRLTDSISGEAPECWVLCKHLGSKTFIDPQRLPSEHARQQKSINRDNLPKSQKAESVAETAFSQLERYSVPSRSPSLAGDGAEALCPPYEDCSLLSSPTVIIPPIHCSTALLGSICTLEDPTFPAAYIKEIEGLMFALEMQTWEWFICLSYRKSSNPEQDAPNRNPLNSVYEEGKELY